MTRPLTEDELRVLRALWGRVALDKALAQTTLHDGAFNGRPACTFGETGPVIIYCSPRFGVATLAHEIGHAIHAVLYPESRVQWSDEKCETFALLATANACRAALRLGFVPLTDGERRDFAFHAWGTRRAGGVYRKALAEAHRIAGSPFLSRQITEAAYGRPN